MNCLDEAKNTDQQTKKIGDNFLLYSKKVLKVPSTVVQNEFNLFDQSFA